MSTTKIENCLREKSPEGSQLLNNLANIKRQAKIFLAKIVETFPEYTLHDIEHSERILEKFSLLIPDSLFEKMNIYELYFLIASTYLHDVGMINLPDFPEPEFEKLADEGNSQVETNKKVREIIRERHHLRSETICIKKYDDYSIDDFHQAAIIGRICRGHRKEDLHSTLFRHDEVYKSYPINVALLASLLRNGDELDLTFERTPYVIYENVPPWDKISKDEWEKHLRISGITVDPDDKQIIKCSARCENPKIHRSLKALEIKVNKGIEDLPSHLHQYREVKRDIPRKIIINIEPIGYEPYDFKFSLQEIKVLELLMGDKLYERKEECLRELLKNAVDACRMRKFRSIDDETYKPMIKFNLSSNKDKLTVTDNGVGMSKYNIENYFTKIGKSFYKSEEFIAENPDFSPVSELGIGVLSYFMIADRVSVETKTEENGDPILLNIDNFSDYFLVEKIRMKNPGTIISLYLKEEAKFIDLESEIRFLDSHLEFPIKVISEGRETSVKGHNFLQNKLLLKTELLERLNLNNSSLVSESSLNLEQLLNNLGLKLYKFNIKTDFIEGKIGFLAINELNSENFFTHPLVKSIFGANTKKESKRNFTSISLNAAKGIADISYGGIHVCFENLTIPWFESMLLADLNFTKNLLDLNIARNKYVQNEKKDKFNDFIEESFLECINNFLTTTELGCKSKGSNFSEQAYVFMNIFIKFPNLSIKNNCIYNKLYLNKYYLKKITEEGIFYIKYDANIFENNQKVVLLTDVPIDTDLQKILSNITGFKKDYIYFAYTQNLYNLIFYFHKKSKDVEILSFCDLLKFTEEYSQNERRSIEYYKDNFKMDIQKFQCYDSSKYIGFIHNSRFVFNLKHKFIKFLLENVNMISEGSDLIIRFSNGFLNISNYALKVTSIMSLQHELLFFCLEKNLISNTEYNDLILRKEDFVNYPYGINF